MVIGRNRDSQRGLVKFGPRKQRCHCQFRTGTNNKHLAIVYNVILLTGLTPNTWCSLRTTLIPKEGDLQDPRNWHPITIGCAAQHLYHRILTRRIKSNTSSPLNQRGFNEADGALTNCILLDTFIKDRRAKTKVHTIIALDIKAFDTVTHTAISQVLRRMSIEQPLIQYVMKDLGTSVTRIKVGNETTSPIRIQRSVKHGDPLSPMIFYMVIDELLVALDQLGIGATIGEHDFKCPAIAFTDDLLPLADNEQDAEILLHTLTQFIKSIIHNKKMISKSKAIFQLDNQDIPMVQAVFPFRYLGHQFGLAGVG